MFGYDNGVLCLKCFLEFELLNDLKIKGADKKSRYTEHPVITHSI